MHRLLALLLLLSNDNIKSMDLKQYFTPACFAVATGLAIFFMFKKTNITNTNDYFLGENCLQPKKSSIEQAPLTKKLNKLCKEIMRNCHDCITYQTTYLLHIFSIKKLLPQAIQEPYIEEKYKIFESLWLIACKFGDQALLNYILSLRRLAITS